MEERDPAINHPGQHHDPEGDGLASEPIGGREWQRLKEPPRVVPKSVCWRTAIAKQSAGTRHAGTGGIVLLMFSLFLVLVDDPSSTAFSWGIGLLGSALLFGMVCILYFRTQQAVDVLTRGEVRSCRIVRIYDRSTKEYVAYESMLDKIDRQSELRLKFHETVGSKYGLEVSLDRHEYHDWPVIIRLEDTGKEMNARVDLRPMINRAKLDSRVRALVADHGARPRLMIIEQNPWLRVSDTGEWETLLRQGSEEFRIGKSLAISFLVTLPTYLLVLCDYLFGANPLFDVQFSANESVSLRTFGAVASTLIFATGPILFFHQNPKLYSNVLFAGLYNGIPILLLASMSGWFSLIWIALYIVRAGRGRRRWAFMQVGATTWSLVIFLGSFSRAELFPVGLVVVLLQVVLLTVMEWKGKHLWVKEGDAG